MLTTRHRLILKSGANDKNFRGTYILFSFWCVLNMCFSIYLIVARRITSSQNQQLWLAQIRTWPSRKKSGVFHPGIKTSMAARYLNQKSKKRGFSVLRKFAWRSWASIKTLMHTMKLYFLPKKICILTLRVFCTHCSYKVRLYITSKIIFWIEMVARGSLPPGPDFLSTALDWMRFRF